jgi:hypothetical protein
MGETLFPPASSPRVLEEALGLIDGTFPLPARFRAALPRDVAELSRLLTAGRGERSGGYLGRPPLLSAYLRYFLPWNLYRLSRLLPALPLCLEEGDAVTDLGSGPLTLPAALWLFRPELRGKHLEFRCLDRTAAALEAGKRLFSRLAGPGCPWTMRIIRAPLGAQIPGGRAALVTALNLFDEVLRDTGGEGRAPRRGAEKQARLLSALASDRGSILVLEPGIPRSGDFIAALRAALLDQGRPPLSPCPHAGPCPLPGGRRLSGAAKGAAPGGKEKWCHFAFDTEDAPEALRRLSAAAGIPKERAVLSFLLAGPSAKAAEAAKPAKALPSPAGGKTAGSAAGGTIPVRIISDAFPVNESPRRGRGRPAPPAYGRYGCSSRGLALVLGGRADLEKAGSGALLLLSPGGEERRDAKSGALVLELPRTD